MATPFLFERPEWGPLTRLLSGHGGAATSDIVAFDKALGLA